MAQRRALTKAQLKRVEADLLERRRLLLADARSKMDGIHGGPSDVAGDEADRAVASYQNDLAAGTAARETREMQRIEEALGRIQASNYGICAECGEAIALARLKALPFAARCIDCQERLEQEGAFNDSFEARC